MSPFSIPKNLLDLTDLFLNLADYLFIDPFGFQLWIIAEFPCDFLDLTLPLVKFAFHLVLCAGFHGVSPFLSGSRFECRAISLKRKGPDQSQNLPGPLTQCFYFTTISNRTLMFAFAAFE
jgi:hypothetical protein